MCSGQPFGTLRGNKHDISPGNRACSPWPGLSDGALGCRRGFLQSFGPSVLSLSREQAALGSRMPPVLETQPNHRFHVLGSSYPCREEIERYDKAMRIFRVRLGLRRTLSQVLKASSRPLCFFRSRCFSYVFRVFPELSCAAT
eukprot:4742972-Amphidinium_carterae.1